MSIRRNTLAVVIASALLATACTTEAERKQQHEANLRLAQLDVDECAHAQGLVEGQPITEDQRTELKWCVTVRWANEELRKGSTDPNVRLISYIANCEASLGKDWGKVGSEKRARLGACINEQAESDITLDAVERTLILQQLQNFNQQKSPTNCYIYGNWVQCQ